MHFNDSITNKTTTNKKSTKTSDTSRNPNVITRMALWGLVRTNEELERQTDSTDRQ